MWCCHATRYQMHHRINFEYCVVGEKGLARHPLSAHVQNRGSVIIFVPTRAWGIKFHPISHLYKLPKGARWGGPHLSDGFHPNTCQHSKL